MQHAWLCGGCGRSRRQRRPNADWDARVRDVNTHNTAKKKNLNPFGTGLTRQRPSPHQAFTVSVYCIFVLIILSAPPSSHPLTHILPHTHTPTTARCFASWGEGKKQKEKEKSVCQGPSPSPSHRQVSVHSHWTPGESDCNTLRRFIDLCVTSRQHLLSESEGGQLFFSSLSRTFSFHICRAKKHVVQDPATHRTLSCVSRRNSKAEALCVCVYFHIHPHLDTCPGFI